MTNRYLTTLVGAFVATIGCSSPAQKKPMTLQEMIAADPIPLAKGSKWTYTVSVKRFDPATEKVNATTIPWTTEVLDATERNGVTAYRVKGWPSDLMDFDSVTPAATERTILRHGNSFLFGGATSWPEPSLDGAEGWFSWPVIDGQKICPSAEMVYCWQVISIENGYKLSFLTGPDEQEFDIEPGTGVARFRYAHHGTTNEVDAKLVSHTKGR